MNNGSIIRYGNIPNIKLIFHTKRYILITLKRQFDNLKFF